ncbi:IS3 family transposase, partial [Nocardia sp. NPDC050710]|uniref:IS3 family transposase n=1 Tax=Nocardia sp. NPDC050710 TaxID=3157220 RepID=UPI0033D0C37C
TGPSKDTRWGQENSGSRLRPSGAVGRFHHDWKILSPAAKRRAVDMLRDGLSMSERFACKVVGLAGATYRRAPLALTPADPDAGLRAWLRAYATKHPGHGFRRAWAGLRHDEGMEVNKKKVHRLWREEGLQVRAHSPRKRAGCSSVPRIDADAPKVLWALDFQFDSTVDRKAVKIASMIDEHTRESLLHLVERSVTAEKLVAELEKVFTAAEHYIPCASASSLMKRDVAGCGYVRRSCIG